MWRPLLSAVVPGSLQAVCISQQCLAVTKHGRWSSNIKMTKQLQKMFDRRSGSKKKIFPGPVNLAINSAEDADLSPRKKRMYTEGQKRRAQQVGKVLYDNIAHLINSGELSDQLAALCVDIVKVKVVPDFSVVNVYWLSSGTDEDAKVQNLLNENAGRLRQLLTSLHILGRIPRICFVRDNSQAHYTEVESLLCAADFGPDFVPTRLDSSIRDMARVGQTESLSAQDRLQAHFNTLNMAAIRHGTNLEQGTSENMDVTRECEDEGVTPESSDSRKSLSAGSADGIAPSRIESMSDRKQELQQHPAFRTCASQPSTLEVEQLGSQYQSTGQENTGTTQNHGISASLEDNTISKVFRDDMYRVPHSNLLKKVLEKKQRAGVRPSFQVSADESETIAPKMKSSVLKSALKKKLRSKNQKPQSDYFESDFVEMDSEEMYTDEEDHEEFEEDVDNDDVSTTDYHPSKN